jgi:guanylate kinase
MTRDRKRFLVLSAPSGAGKTTIARALVKRNNDMVISVSATTRPKRPREVDGRDYFFLSQQKFEEYITQGNFLEYERVHGYYYGTLKHVVENWLKNDKVVVFDIDVNGALAIKKQYPGSILIFIKAPSFEELKRRLIQRKSESNEDMATRLKRLNYENEQAGRFDYIVINEDLYQTVIEIESLFYQYNRRVK